MPRSGEVLSAEGNLPVYPLAFRKKTLDESHPLG
jgi:hypothetical protein